MPCTMLYDQGKINRFLKRSIMGPKVLMFNRYSYSF